MTHSSFMTKSSKCHSRAVLSLIFSLIVCPRPGAVINFTKHAYFSPSLFWSFYNSEVLHLPGKTDRSIYMILLPFQDYQCCPQNSYWACHSNRLESIPVSQRDHIMSYSTELHWCCHRMTQGKLTVDIFNLIKVWNLQLKGPSEGYR